MNMLSVSYAYHSRRPYPDPDDIERRKWELVSEQSSEVRETRSDASRLLARFTQRQFRLGSPFKGFTVEHVREVLLAMVQAGECDPGDWEQEGQWLAEKELEEWS